MVYNDPPVIQALLLHVVSSCIFTPQLSMYDPLPNPLCPGFDFISLPFVYIQLQPKHLYVQQDYSTCSSVVIVCETGGEVRGYAYCRGWKRRGSTIRIARIGGDEGSFAVYLEYSIATILVFRV